MSGCVVVSSSFSAYIWGKGSSCWQRPEYAMLVVPVLHTMFCRWYSTRLSSPLQSRSGSSWRSKFGFVSTFSVYLWLRVACYYAPCTILTWLRWWYLGWVDGSVHLFFGTANVDFARVWALTLLYLFLSCVIVLLFRDVRPLREAKKLFDHVTSDLDR